MKKRYLLRVVLCILLVSSMLLNVLAAGSGTYEDPTITTTELPAVESTNPETGEKTVTETTVTTTYGETDGNVVEGTETRVDTSVTNAEGTTVQHSWTEEGSEKKTHEVTENVPEITISVIKDQTVAESPITESSELENTGWVGDVKEGEDDKTYDQSQTTVEQQREVTVEVGEIEVTLGCEDNNENYESSQDIGLEALNPVWNENKEQVKAPVQKLTNEEIAELLKTKPDGYDFIYIGAGEDSLYGADWNFDPSDENYYEWGYGTGTAQFQLGDFSNPDTTVDEMDVVTGFCADVDTGSKLGFWYKVENLEDAEYYKKNGAEDHIRAIAMNGYWGTTGTDDKGAPVTGSLDALKAVLKDAKENGDEETKAMLADLDVDALTEGEALTATQMSFWLYGNPYDADSGIAFEANTLDVGSPWWEYSTSELKNTYGMTSEDIAAAKDRINAVYDYLTSLELTAEESGTTEIINEEKFVESMELTVKDKVEDHANNADENAENDAYYVDLSFALVVELSEENKDDLIVKILDNEGNVVRFARLAGAAAENEAEEVGYCTLKKEGATYTFEDLELVEGSGMTFDLKLEGAQYLEQGVYLYTSEVRDYDADKDGVIEENEKDRVSQTFVGVGEGYRSVDVSAEIDLTFSVDEAVVIEERQWAEEGDPWTEIIDTGDDDIILGDDDDDDKKTTGDDDDDDKKTTGDDDDDTEDIQDEDTPLEDIYEEEIPLADVPRTGDMSGLWLALSALSGSGLLVMTQLRKKREEEEE